MLADIWGKIYLFHPGIVRKNIGAEWKLALTETIPEIENAADTAQIVSVLNAKLFKPLNDPLTFARQKPRPDLLPEDHKSESSEFTISGEISPVIRVGPDMLRSESLLNHLNHLAASLQDKTSLIVDLRWAVPYDDNIPHTFFRFFADSACRAVPRIRRIHHGWNEDGEPYIYRQAWDVADGIRLNPFPEACRLSCIPVVFLISNSSILHFWEPLSALQTRPGIRVIWEQTGSFSIPKSEAISYDENVTVHLNTLLTGFQPDLIRPMPIPFHEMPELVERVLEEKSKRKSPLFPPPMQFPEPEPVSDRLSREDRLMGLFKTWVILRHFSPFSNTTDWNAILYEWIPKVENAKDPKEYYQIFEKFTAQLHDSHVQVRHRMTDKTAVLPIRLKYVEGKVVVGEIKGEPEILLGDEIIRINEAPIGLVEKQWRKRISASSDQAFRRDFLHQVVIGEKGEHLKLSVRSSDRIREIRLPFLEPSGAKEDTQNENTPAFFPMPRAARHIRILENKIGYMTPFTMPNAKTLDNAFQLLADTDGLVIDLRGYPRTHFQHELLRHLCRKTVCSPRYEIPLVGYQNTNMLKWEIIQYMVTPHVGRNVYDKPVVALTDETTQSSAEDFCMYLRNADRAFFVGTPTAGCHGNMAFVDLPGGGWLSFTGMRVTWPDGTPFQGIGIIPDVEVRQTIRGLRQSQDEILEKGVRTLKGLITN